MASLVQGKAVRLIDNGILVSRAAAQLPQNGAGSIFTISGGRVFINALVGEVAVALGSTAQTISVGVANPSVTNGTVATAMGTQSTSIASAPAGAHIIANPGGQTTYAAGGTGGAVATLKSPYMVDTGSITLTTSAANATGTVGWTLLYVPLDDGASVTAA